MEKRLCRVLVFVRCCFLSLPTSPVYLTGLLAVRWDVQTLVPSPSDLRSW